MPGTPNILCPEKAAKSAPSLVTSTGTCPTLWLQSKHNRIDGSSWPLSSASVVIEPNRL